MRKPRPIAVAAVALLAAAVLSACSSGSSGSSGSESSAAAASSAPSAAASGEQQAGTDAMRALCDQMVADGLSPEDATKLAEDNGYVARVGSIDGQPQAVTMDYREDRFTFDVEGGAVVGCTYG